MMNPSIESFDITLYDEVLALWKRCEGVGLSDADSKEAIRMYLERNPGMSFVAKAGGKVVGAILAGHDGRRGYIHHLAVDGGGRRQGIARQLVEKCLGVLKASGIQKTHIFIFRSNESGIAFWKSLGWTYRTDISVVSKTI
jgi:ribosomal protein S18 acetylase RimI-like enzyme